MSSQNPIDRDQPSPDTLAGVYVHMEGEEKGLASPRTKLPRHGENPMIELSNEQARLLHENNQSSPEVIDPHTKERYVLVRREVYERLQALLDEGFTAEDAFQAQIESAAAAGWDDPALDVYNNLEPDKP